MVLPERVRSGDLLKLAWPVGLEHLFNLSLVWVDSIMINRKLGTEAFAAVQLSGQVINLIGLILIVVATGASVVLAHQVGAGDRAKGSETASQSAGLAVLAGLGLGVFVYAMAPTMLGLLGATGEAHTAGVAYLRILAVFLPTNGLIAVLGAILRSSGNTRGPMTTTLLINLLNAGFNYVLIWHLNAGLVGAAYATSIARIGGVALLLWLAMRSDVLPIRLDAMFRFRKDTVLRITRMGAPGAFEFISWQGGQFVLSTIVAPLGLSVIAARGLTFQTESFTFMPAVGMGAAASILVGQFMGAGRRDDAVKTAALAMKMGVAGIAVLALVLAVFPRQLAQIFTTDPEVLAYATLTLRISALYKIGQCLNMVCGGIYRGAGNPQWPTYLTTAGTWLMTVPLSYLFVQMGYGLAGVLWAMCIDEWIRGAVNLWYYTTPRWRFRTI